VIVTVAGSRSGSHKADGPLLFFLQFGGVLLLSPGGRRVWFFLVDLEGLFASPPFLDAGWLNKPSPSLGFPRG